MELFFIIVIMLAVAFLWKRKKAGNRPMTPEPSSGGVDYREEEKAKAILKEAAGLKKSKDFAGAIEKLKSAYSAKGARVFSVREYLRLPMYLQLAGRNDEGWTELNRLNIEWTDYFSQAEIAKQMRIFLVKEKKFDRALLAIMWEICKEVERDRRHLMGINNDTKDVMYRVWKQRIKEFSMIEHIEPRLKKYCKNKDKGLEKTIATALSQYLKSEEFYDFGLVKGMLQTHRALGSPDTR